MKAISWNAQPERFRQGVSLVELVVVLAVIGVLGGLAAVYVGSGETALRSSMQNFRFHLEAAKSEAVTRRAEVSMDFFMDAPSFDCNRDGAVDGKDRCYVLFQDLDGNGMYDPDAEPPERIRSEALVPPVRFSRFERLTFSPLGGATQSTLRIESAVPSDCDDVTPELECLVTAYGVTMQSSGRVRVGEKEQRCDPIESCT